MTISYDPFFTIISWYFSTKSVSIESSSESNPPRFHIPIALQNKIQGIIDNIDLQDKYEKKKMQT